MKHLTVTQAVCALTILSRKLDEVAKSEHMAGLTKSAAATVKEKEFVEQLILAAAPTVRKDEEELSTRERAAIRSGLKLYCRNARAASGTVTGLGRTEWADMLTKEAEELETKVLPGLEDQTELKLASGSEK